MPMPAAIDRIGWLPNSIPASPVSEQICIILAAVLPMFVWDVVRNRRVHEAYWIWLGICLPVCAGDLQAVGHAVVACDGATDHGCVTR